MGYFVYKHTSPSGKVYIGITQQRPEKRWGGGGNYGHNHYFSNAIQKYGWDQFTHELLHSDLSREEAKAKEQELIAYYDSSNRAKGYNISPGGMRHTEETKEKIRLRRAELKLNELQSKRAKERWADPEYRERAVLNMRGKVRSPESRERYRQAALRREPPKPESIERMREALRQKTGKDAVRKRPVLQIAPMTLEVVGRYWTAREAAASVGAGMNYIASTCRKSGNETKATHGYFWCYEDEYDPADFEPYRGIEFSDKGKLPRTVGDRVSHTKHTEAAKKRMSEAHSRSVQCVETGEIFLSIQEAERAMGTHGAISRCVRGKTKTSCNYHWVYSDATARTQ